VPRVRLEAILDWLQGKLHAHEQFGLDVGEWRYFAAFFGNE
jgi:hypothetical protein